MSGEIRPLTSFSRVGAHSHIKGLGLDENGRAKPIAAGFVGQCRAREAAGIIVRMVREGKMAGRAVLLAGPPGTGKTAIAHAIAQELGHNVPFVVLAGSEIYSAEVKKTEVLYTALRKAIGVRIREYRRVYEGEVAKLTIEFDKHPYNPYVQVPASARLTLRTTREERTFSVGSRVATQLVQLGVREGDVIMIDAETARVSRIGRSKEAPREYEIEGEVYVPRPTGSIEKEKEFVYYMTLHDLDRMVAERRGFGGLISIFFGGSERREIDVEVRQEVDRMVRQWVEEGRAEIIPGVLFIDEVHMLDIEAFSFLSRAIESELAPVVIFASNRGIARIRGTDIESPHAMPLDLLDRLLIIETEPYKPDEIREILKIRAREENVELEPDALEELTKIGAESSLRYAVQLLTPAKEHAKLQGHSKVAVEDIRRVHELFADVRRSVQTLKKYEELMMR